MNNYQSLKAIKKYAIGVWNETIQEWQTLWCSEKTYQLLLESKEKYKKKYDTFVEPYIIYQGDSHERRS